MISGPEATAGSMFIFLNIKGITVPDRPDKNIADNKAAPVQNETANAEMAGCPFAASK